MLPPQRRQVLQQLAIHRLPRFAHRLGGAFQVHRVPQHDGGRHQVETAGPVALLLEAPIPDFAEAVEEHRPGQGVARLALVQPGEGQAGDDIPFRFRITAGKDSGLAIALSVVDSKLEGVHVPAGQALDVILPIPSAHRGYLRPDKVRIETRFPFGLLKAWSWLRPSSAGIAYPRPLVAPEVISQVDDGSEARSSAPVAGQDNADLRPWREGDLSQRVMWKRFARSGQMVVADWEGEQGSPHWLDFNAFPGADTDDRKARLR